MEEKVKDIFTLDIYSPEWWAKIPDALTFIPEEHRAIIVFSVV